MKENTEKQEQVIQEVKTEETNTPVEQQTPTEEKVSYSQVTEDGTFKVDLSKLKQFQEQEEKQKENEPVQKSETKEVDVQEQTGISKAVGEEIKKQEEETQKEEVVLEEISQEEVEQQVEQQNLVVDEVSPEQPKQPEVVVPENLQDLVKFMEETGGSLEDYTRLNADYSKVDDSTLLKEYYKNTKPHLDLEEIDFLIEDTFYFDEDIDEPRNIKKKKLAFKEEIVKAKKHLTGLKDQYYKEVELGSKLTSE